MKFSSLIQGKWVSNKLNNGDWDYWLVIELIDMVDAVGEREAREAGYKYIAELSAVSPSAAGPRNVQTALSSCGMEGEANPLAIVEALHSYGIKARVWDDNGNNASKLLKQAREQAKVKGDFMFGFAMDSRQNALGAKGWDFIKGQYMPDDMRRTSLIKRLGEFGKGYIQCLLFSCDASTEADQDNATSLHDAGYDIDRIATDSLETIADDCQRFYSENREALDLATDSHHAADSFGRTSYSGLEVMGHCFAYSRNGHGVGFFDCEHLPDNVREALQDKVRAYKEQSLYIGDDDSLYVM